LNIVDVLSGDDEYVEIRRRKPHHSTLQVVDDIARSARNKEFEDRLQFEKEFEDAIAEAEAKNEKATQEFQDRVDKLQKRQEDGEEVSLTDLNAAAQALNIKKAQLTQELEVTRERSLRNKEQRIKQVRRETDMEIRKIQTRLKIWAVAIPPIPPIIVGFVVFVVRRLREREGIAKSRLR
jgi:ABC-2 type transport system permease protein